MATKAHRPLRVCIDARLKHGMWGGVEQLVLGLAAGLSRLGDGEEEYLFLTYEGEDGWLAEHLGGALRPLRIPVSARLRFAQLPRWLTWPYGVVRGMLGPLVPRSDGTIERANVDLVHFTYQDAFLTDVRSIYHPHDLQHVHLPQYFSFGDRRWRDVVYRAYCEQAAMVAVSSSWVKRDLVAQLGLAPDKIQVVPLAPLVAHYAAPTAEVLAGVRSRYRLPERFALYPAQTWPHKNHVGLLEAIARVRERCGEIVPLVSTGRLNDFHVEVRRAARRLGLERDVFLLGFVSPGELHALYRLARCVVVPTLFEAASFPLWEAFQSGVPAACSNVTSLPEQAGDAAVVFDPRDREAMADALWTVWQDEPTRRRLVERGRARVAQFTWERTARTFRAHYRRLAGRALDAADRALLEAPPPL
jgi:glycosyltransferase involved in cell wall biosynthesis